MKLLNGVRLSMLAVLAAAGCQNASGKSEVAMIPADSAEKEYVCGGGVHMAVRFLDSEAMMAVDGAPAVTLARVPGRSGTTYYSDGKQMIILGGRESEESEEMSWVRGRSIPQSCLPRNASGKSEAAMIPAGSTEKEYICSGGAHIAVRFLDSEATVAVDRAPAVTLARLPTRSGKTYYSDGELMLILGTGESEESEEISWVRGRSVPKSCLPA